MAASYIVTVNNQSAVSCLVDCITATDTINNSTAAVTIVSLESITFIINAAVNGYINNKSVSGAPFIDSTAIIKGSSDATKLVRIEADGITTGTTRVITVPDSDVTLFTVANQAEMEAASIVSAAVTPLRQHFHPSAAKAWGWVDRSGGTPVLGALDYGIASVTDDGAAQTIVTFDTAMSGTNYIPLTSCTNDGATNPLALWHTRATGSVKVVVNTGGGVAMDTNSFTIGIFGDQ